MSKTPTYFLDVCVRERPQRDELNTREEEETLENNVMDAEGFLRQ